MSTERVGVQWHTLQVEDLPPYIQGYVRAWYTDAVVVCWVEQAACWHTDKGPLPDEVSSAILGYVIRLRREEPHVGFPNGHVFYYLDPESSYCQLADLEKNLEGQNRYAGSVRWTVGQHWRFCVELSRIRQRWWPECMKEPVLLLVKYHDHAEGVCQDLNAGLKRALRKVRGHIFSEFDELEARADEWLRRRTPDVASEAVIRFVKWVDQRAAWIEMQQLGFPNYFVEEAADEQTPVLPEEVEAFKRIQGEGRVP